MIPTNKNTSKEKHYRLICLNSHGGVLETTKSHIRPISKKKYKTATLSEPLDFILMKRLVASFDNYCKTTGVKNQTLEYKGDSQHNYFGANLQVHDDYGCCFIYPIVFNLVLFTHMRNSFRKNSKSPTNNSIELLKTGQIDLFVYECLAQVDGKINKYIDLYANDKTRDLDDLEEDIEKHLDIYEERFIQNMLCKVLRFVKQPYWSMARISMNTK